MAGASIEVDDQLVLARLGELVDRATNMEPVYRDISEYGFESTRQRIENGGPAPNGDPWAPLSPVTRERKTKNKDKLLVYYGRLLGSIHPQPSANEAAWGTNVVYAAAMQFGMPKGYAGQDKRGHPIPWGDIPARPFLGISEADRAEILAILNDWFSFDR